jgi:hypothetical protein
VAKVAREDVGNGGEPPLLPPETPPATT